MRILIVEDEASIAKFVRQGLSEAGYAVDMASDGEEGLSYALSAEYDVLILDIMLPRMSGLEVIRELRNQGNKTPTLMLTARDTVDDRVQGLDAGADDYLVKPFEFRELLARIKALTKRTSGSIETSDKLKVADLELDLNKKIAIRGGKKIELTAKEFLLLEFFMRNAGKVLSRNLITEKVWEIDFDTNTNVVDVYVNILRKKIDKGYEPKLIHTKIGMGYIFDAHT